MDVYILLKYKNSASAETGGLAIGEPVACILG